MNLFKGVAIFIGWLTGSLAGIGAILYACGYLVTRAQLNLLGLYGFFEYSNEHFLQEGAKFFIVLGYAVAKIFLPLLIIVGVISFGFFLLMVCCFRGTARLERSLHTWGDRLTKFDKKIPWRIFLYFLLFLLFMFHSDIYLDKFNSPLLVSGLLYTSPSGEHTVSGCIIKGDEADKIKQWLIEGNTECPQIYFFHLLLYGEILAGALFLLAWHVTLRYRLRFLMLSPFMIGFMLYTVSLPMIYGVLVRPVKYAVIAFGSGDEAVTREPEAFFLLNKTEHEFIAWDARRRRVRWISKDEVKRAEVQRIENLFSRH